MGNLFTRVETFLTDYCAFPNPNHAPVVALWCLGTWVYRSFDAFPYLVITAATKQAGKSRLAELMSMVSHQAKNFAAMTPAVMFRAMDGVEGGVSIFFDEAESLSSEAAGVMRSVLNVGYRRGQTIPRMVNGEVKEFAVYCPKVFILIGDVYDTLRDRSIVIELQRGFPKRIFRYTEAMDAARALAIELKAEADTLSIDPMDCTGFLGGREAEIWAPILTLAQLVCPDRYDEIVRAAVDLGADKKAPARRYVDSAEAETAIENDQYSAQALRDMADVFRRTGQTRLFTEDVLQGMRDIPTAPWRRFRGEGLTAQVLSNLVSRFGVKPKLVRAPRRGKSVDVAKRGYQLANVKKGLAKLGKESTS